MTKTDFNLPKRIQLQEIKEGHWAIVKLIKSRIIQKNTLKIIEVAKQMKTLDSTIQVSLICHDNICSKSVALLKENEIDIIIR